MVGSTQQFTATLKDAGGVTLTGRTVVWASSTPAVATVSASGLVTGIAAGSTTITATTEGKSATASITVTSTATKPGAVTDLKVASVTNNSVTLTFTEVNDGSGNPASYDIRGAAGTFAWWSAVSVSQGTCAAPVAGTAIGAKRSCTVLGLNAATAYQFQLVALRGTLNVNATFGALSNVASGTTVTGPGVPPPPPPAPVATVSVTPAAASVTVGGDGGAGGSFYAMPAGTCSSGRGVTWSSNALSVATVNVNGLATALVVGSAAITATSEGQSGTAAVTGLTSPPPPAGGAWANEPTGFTTVTDFGFDNFSSGGWRTNSGPTITTDASALVSPSNVAQWRYPQGFAAGASPGDGLLRSDHAGHGSFHCL